MLDRLLRPALIAVVLLLAAAVFWVILGSPLPSRSPDEARLTAMGESEGRAIYMANCATCHGERGEGESRWQSPRDDGTYPAPPHDSSGHTWHHDDELLFTIVKQGGFEDPLRGRKSGMPAWGGILSDEQIVAVLEYIKTIWGSSEREFQANLSENRPYPMR